MSATIAILVLSISASSSCYNNSFVMFPLYFPVLQYEQYPRQFRQFVPYPPLTQNSILYNPYNFFTANAFNSGINKVKIAPFPKISNKCRNKQKDSDSKDFDYNQLDDYFDKEKETVQFRNLFSKTKEVDFHPYDIPWSTTQKNFYPNYNNIYEQPVTEPNNNLFVGNKITAVFRDAISETERINNHPNWKYLDREMCGETLADRIIGGKTAELGQYPWLAMLFYKNSSKPYGDLIFSCGGAIINPSWIVSAAHCISGLPEYFYLSEIRLGEHNIETDIDCDTLVCSEPVQKFSPTQMYVHEDFNNPKLKNDISLIKLDHPAVFSRWVTPICLPYGHLLTADLIGKVGEVAGWGIKNITTGASSKVLQVVKLIVKPNVLCQSIYKKKIKMSDTQLCVGGTLGFDSCNGDSGGPFMKVDVAESTPKYFLFGVVSFGALKCGVRPIPGVYTKISKYMMWILDRITKY